MKSLLWNIHINQKNHWRGSGGQTPKNLDLFQLLMEAVEFAEEDFDVRVKFWWIPRECNELADKLARAGARDAEPLPTPSSS